MTTHKFGGKWNEHTYNIEVSWYKDNPYIVTITRPFNSDTMTLNMKEASQLRDALNHFLEDHGE